ncbi:MAG: methyl-accepting chemotaxis protein [Pseudomonadota bacterium]
MLSEAVSRCPDTMPLLAEFAEMADTFRDAIAEGKDDLSRELYRRAADFASGRPAEASTELSAAMRAVAAEFRASSVRSAQHAQARTQNGRSEITDIAKTIRLISLNARIEAARAGTAGRAFGVIAEEIKLLSDRTTMATDEVGRGIDAIMSQFHGAKETSLPASSHPRPTAGCGAAQDRQMGE